MGRPTLPVRLFFFLVGLLLLPCRPVLAQTTIEYYHLDALGSVRAVTNQQGQVIRTHDFQPFGEEENAAPVQTDVRLFTGKERDKETALDYFGARYMRAEIARFTTVDPVVTLSENLVDPQRWNRYAYVRNNPLRFTDPDGRALVEASIKALKAAVKAARQRAVRQAWRMERQLVEATGVGTFNWSKEQVAQLLKNGKVRGFVGHHINNVADHPELAGVADNVMFVEGGAKHLAEHSGDWRTPTSGSLLNRSLGGAGVAAFFATYDAKMDELASGSPLLSRADSWLSYVNPFNNLVEGVALLHGIVAASNAK